MKVFLPVKLLLLFSVLFVFCPPLYGFERKEYTSFIAAGIGLETLSYTEQVQELELASSDTDLTYWILNLEGRKVLQSFFIAASGVIPLSTDEAQEYWIRAGDPVQTNTLTYQWTRIDARTGYLLFRSFNPYVGIHWQYSEQKRSGFENAGIPGVSNKTATEEVHAFSVLFGIQGEILFTDRWSFSYAAEYMLPFYSSITNDNLSGWEASNIDGYGYSLSGQLQYALTDALSTALQISGGRQHWEGSDWISIGEGRAKWPENNTDFFRGLMSIYWNF